MRCVLLAWCLLMLIPTSLINHPERIPESRKKHVTDLISKTTEALRGMPFVLQRWNHLLVGPVVIKDVDPVHCVCSILDLDRWNIVDINTPQTLGGVIRWVCVLINHTWNELHEAGLVLAGQGRVVVISALVLKVFELLASLPKVSSNQRHRTLVYQFLIATKYKCSQTEKPFPKVDLIDALETSDLKWRARIEAGFRQCMDTAEAFMKGAGFTERERELLRRGLAINISDVFLGKHRARPLAQSCRDASKLLKILCKAAHGLSEDAPINMFSEILKDVHTDPSEEASSFYAKNKARTAFLGLPRTVQLDGRQQTIVECLTGWPSSAAFALCPKSMACLVALAGVFTSDNGKDSSIWKSSRTKEARDARLATYMQTESQQDDVMPVMEELLYTVTGRDGGPMRLSNQDAAQQAEEFLKQPELCERMRQYIAGQAGDGLPVVLPWEKANVGKGPQNQATKECCDCKAAKQEAEFPASILIGGGWADENDDNDSQGDTTGPVAEGVQTLPMQPGKYKSIRLSEMSKHGVNEERYQARLRQEEKLMAAGLATKVATQATYKCCDCKAVKQEDEFPASGLIASGWARVCMSCIDKVTPCSV